MKQLKYAAMVVVSVMMAMNISCSREQYNAEKAQQGFDSVSPVDSIDATHTWLLTKTRTLVVEAPEVTDGTAKVRILTANPRRSGDAQVVGEAFATAAQPTEMTIAYPATITTLYAALVDGNDRYSIVRFDPDGADTISFSDLIVDHEQLSYEPQPQQFTFCFEDSYPYPGDYDYNDVVLRVSQERTGEREMRFNVTLAAVGTIKPVFSAIRLVDYNATDIESIITVDSLSFNTTNGKDIPNQMLTPTVQQLKNKNSFLLEGNNGEAVISLFWDAHWGTGDLLEENYGQIERKYYNVSLGTGTNNAQFVPRTVTYIVTFKSGAALNHFTLNDLDPFLCDNSSIFEVHQYRYREAQVLTKYTYTTIKSLPWVICIPTKSFRWPLEGTFIGYINEGGHTYGPYQKAGHSFGEWVRDHTQCLDWYEYPIDNQVFYSTD